MIRWERLNRLSAMARLIPLDFPEERRELQLLMLHKLKASLLVTPSFLFLCSAAFADTAILVALPSELNGVRKEVRIVGQSVELAGHKVSIGYHKGEKIYIVATGAGNLNSAMVTQAVLDRKKVARVISIGVAGNLNEKWAVGDVLCVTNVVSHQAGKETPSGFETGGPSAVSRQLSAEYSKKCEELRQAVTDVTTEILHFAQYDNNRGDDTGKPKAESRKPTTSLRSGKLVSGDSFIASTAKRKWLHDTFNADAVDMVSAGIARVCEANGIPYVIIRVLSDNADETASQDFATFVNAYKEPVTVPIAIGLLDRLVTKSP